MYIHLIFSAASLIPGKSSRLNRRLDRAGFLSEDRASPRIGLIPPFVFASRCKFDLSDQSSFSFLKRHSFDGRDLSLSFSFSWLARNTRYSRAADIRNIPGRRIKGLIKFEDRLHKRGDFTRFSAQPRNFFLLAKFRIRFGDDSFVRFGELHDFELLYYGWKNPWRGLDNHRNPLISLSNNQWNNDTLEESYNSYRGERRGERPLSRIPILFLALSSIR